MNRDRISKEIEETYAKEPKTFALKLGIAFIVVLLLAWSSSTMEIADSGLDGMKKKHMVRVSVRKSEYSETDPLVLPKEILPELQSLLTQSTIEISHWKWRGKRG